MTTETSNVQFTAKDVMTLRQKTGLGMMECKEALTEAGGDPAQAEEILRARRKGKMDTRTERATGEGRVEILVDGSNAAIVEVRTESDFTARNDSFVQMVNDMAKAALKQPAGPVTVTDEMAKRIDDVRLTTGENMNLARGEKLTGGSFGKYVHHDGKSAVLLQIDGTADETLLKGLCQHILFHDPLAISEDDVPKEKTDSIRAEAIAEAKETGKNDEIAEKIAQGKVRKYLEEKTLVHQKYILDEEKTIAQILPKDVKIKRYVRYMLGAG